MARKLTVYGQTFRYAVEKVNGEAVRAEILNDTGDVTHAVVVRGADGRWSCEGTSGRYGSDADMLTAVRRWTRFVAARRPLVPVTLEVALVDNREFDARRARIAAHKARIADEAALRAKRRRENPAVVVESWDVDVYIGGERVTVRRPSEVQVYGEHFGCVRLLGSLGDAEALTVSFPSASGMTPAEAREYAAAIMRAADEAETWTRVTYPALVRSRLTPAEAEAADLHAAEAEGTRGV